MYFTAATKAHYYDCDCNNRLKISSAMKYMQQTSSEQLEYLGFSVEKLLAEDMVFLLSKMCVKVHRMPVCNERLVVGTAATTPRGARFVREFVLDSLSGERMISALSLWILVNPATRKILRPAKFPYDMSFQKEQLDGVIDDISFPKQEGLERPHVKIPVRYSHIDVNHHVNNTVYADFVCDLLPYDQLSAQGIDTLVISFQNEAKWGDVVEIYTNVLGRDEYHVVGLHGDAPCFEALALLGPEP